MNNASPNSTPDPAPQRKRRPRYSGKNPRNFLHKYKEHGPNVDATTIEKVIASGKTPAGMHRPVMVQEVIEALQLKAGMKGVDCTTGYGGHAREILKLIAPNGVLLCIDTDPIELPRTEQRLRAEGFSEENCLVHRMNFAGIMSFSNDTFRAPFNFLLADLGVSSMQLDNPERGFTYKSNGPLDLRMNPLKGIPASQLLAKLDERQLTQLITESDERHAPHLAEKILAKKPNTTLGLAQIVRDTKASQRVTGEEVEKSIARVFQALRIEVNGEFEALETLLKHLPTLLIPGGRAAMISFHSGEDRRVKAAFAEGHRSGAYSEISEIIRPSSDEIRSNSRSSPARVRWVQKA
ncbi:MAG: 16S rRNA (cytosine(1402)-N(4))-methyltransferase RsmH [Verrucomicrobiota bacterium]|nr:16S rRNA (cytosine(1402)-N(4))-methyltransferase RsmH [Verrucomicrobiota bacterium]